MIVRLYSCTENCSECGSGSGNYSVSGSDMRMQAFTVNKQRNLEHNLCIKTDHIIKYHIKFKRSSNVKLR